MYTPPKSSIPPDASEAEKRATQIKYARYGMASLALLHALAGLQYLDAISKLVSLGAIPAFTFFFYVFSISCLYIATILFVRNSQKGLLPFLLAAMASVLYFATTKVLTPTLISTTPLILGIVGALLVWKFRKTLKT